MCWVGMGRHVRIPHPWQSSEFSNPHQLSADLCIYPTQAFDFRDRYLEKAGASIFPGLPGCVSLGLKILTPSLLGLSFPSGFWRESSLGSSLSQQVWYNSNRSQAGSACISPSSGAFPVLVFL